MLLALGLTAGASLFAKDGRILSPVKDQDDALSRLHDRTTKVVYEMKGRGSSSRWCLKGSVHFNYTIVMEAESKILEKTPLPGGGHKVVERHMIKLVSDKLGVSKEDLTIHLDDFDKKKFDQYFYTACGLIAIKKPEIAAIMIGSKKATEAILVQFDGMSVKKALEDWGIPSEALVRDPITDQLQQAFRAKIRPNTGKTYRTEYTLNRNNIPITMEYTYADGTPVTDEEEKQILDRLNLFIDTQVVPDRKCRVGDIWTIHAEDIEQMMDPYVDGHYKGNITVKRSEDNKDGTWNIAMMPASLVICDENGKTTGNIRLDKGSGIVDQKNGTIEEIHVEGFAKLNRVSRHHWFFQAQVSGRSKFVGHLESIRMK